MPSDPPLTDEEICRKFEIARDDPHFESAKALSRNRHDRTICDFPELMCPHCGGEFIYSEGYDESDWATGDKIICNQCERTICVEHADYKALLLTLNTDPEPST